MLSACSSSKDSAREPGVDAQSGTATEASTNSQPALQIISHPQSAEINENAALTLKVQATSNSALRYQWYKDDQPIDGAIYPTYSKNHSRLSDTGIYYAVVSTNNDTQRSLAAHVNVNKTLASISFIQTPQSQTITQGDALLLSVQVGGDGPFTYQWQKGGSLIPNATANYYLVSSSKKSDEGTYRVVVSNASSTLYSAFVNVWITDPIEPLSIVKQPVSQIVPETMNAHLSVTVSGGGFIRYQWRKNGQAINNANDSTLTLENLTLADQAHYDVVIANSRGSLVSEAAFLDVLASDPQLEIIKQPLSKAVSAGEGFSLSVGAISDTPLSYQWYLNDQAIYGAVNPIYSVSQASLHDIGEYSVLVSNHSLNLRSNPASISVEPSQYFSIELNWDTPRTREDGSPLEASEILAYAIEYDYSPNGFNHRVEVPHQSVNSHILDGIQSGTLYLRIATIDSKRQQGAFSETISLHID